MTPPRRPRAGRTTRRPAAAARGRSTASGRPLRPARPGAPTVDPRAGRPSTPALRGGSPVTTRAAILGLVVCTLVFSAALPLRTYFAQRAEISSMEREQAETRERVEALEHARQQLEDPAFVAAEARRRLHMARPGEVTYVVIPPEGEGPADAAEGAAPPAGGPEAPWWAQVWASVAEADQPAADEPAAQPGPAAPAP